MDWVESIFNGYTPHVYNGSSWQSVNKTYAYWEQQSTNDWYIFDSAGTTIIGLTAKLTNPPNPTDITFDPTYGWGQSSYIIPNNVTDIDRNAFVNYYDKGGTTAISSLPVAPPTQSCSIYFHDNMSFSRTSGENLFVGYPPLNKVRFPNTFTGLNNNGSVFALFGTNPSNVPLSRAFEEIVIPPNFIAVTNDNFGSSSFSKEFFPNLERVKIMRSTSSSAINFVNLSFWGTALWNSDLGSIGTVEAINPVAEIYLDFDESEILSKINFNTAAPDTDLTTFKGVFYYLKSQGQVYFNQTIVND